LGGGQRLRAACHRGGAPLNGLAPIDAIDHLPKRFDQVFAPQTVLADLTDPDMSPAVRPWATRAPEGFRRDPDPPARIDEAM